MSMLFFDHGGKLTWPLSAWLNPTPIGSSKKKTLACKFINHSFQSFHDAWFTFSFQA